jgi:hypothetical protein
MHFGGTYNNNYKYVKKLLEMQTLFTIYSAGYKYYDLYLSKNSLTLYLICSVFSTVAKGSILSFLQYE